VLKAPIGQGKEVNGCAQEKDHLSICRTLINRVLSRQEGLKWVIVEAMWSGGCSSVT
jgi:hypothetical protein